MQTSIVEGVQYSVPQESQRHVVSANPSNLDNCTSDQNLGLYKYLMQTNYSKQTISKFVLVGLSATGLHLVIVAILIETMSVSAGAANVLAFVLATSWSYYLNTVWSFSTKVNKRNATRFIVVSVVGAMLAFLISSSAERYALHYVIGVAGVVSIVPIISFLAHRYWTYRV